MATKHTQCTLCGKRASALGAHYVGHHPLTDEVRQEIADYARSHRRNLRLPMLCRRFGRGHDAIRAILIEAGVRLPGMKRAPFEHLAIGATDPPAASPPPAAGVEVHTSPAMNAFTAEAFVEAFLDKLLSVQRQVISLQQEVVTLRGDLAAAEELLEVQRSTNERRPRLAKQITQVAATLGLPTGRHK